MLVKKEWFIEWFDSPYYHVLYSNRDDHEAHFFINNLCTYLKLNPEKHSITDLACGKGRHSIFLNSLGYQVTGIDLSKHSIEIAKKSENDRLTFEVQDLRDLKSNRLYDVALNLFTSFGYFASLDENSKVINNIHQILSTGGVLIIDFMNSHKVVQNLIEHDSKTINGIRFHITKWMENNFIHKKITVDDDDTTIEFTEKVQALELKDFEEILHQNGFTIVQKFGDYSLNPFNVSDSDRLILIAQKID